MSALTEIKGGGEIPLPSKVAQVMGELGTIEKRGKFKVGHNVQYQYVQAADMYEAVRTKLSDRGVAFQASFVEILATREIPTRGGGSMHEVTVAVKCSLYDGATGENMVANWAGSGMDSGDKAIYKAFTGAVKSWLMTTFLVPSDTDPDDSVADKTRRQSSKGQTAADRKTMAGLLKAFIRDGRRSDDEGRVRLALTKLGVSDVSDFNKAVVGLDQAKANKLMAWLDDELVKRQAS